MTSFRQTLAENFEPRERVAEVANLLADAKSIMQDVLANWDLLPDVDASSGELEQVVELLGQLVRDLDDAADDI